jgi:hypothetical protein
VLVGIAAMVVKRSCKVRPERRSGMREARAHNDNLPPRGGLALVRREALAGT